MELVLLSCGMTVCAGGMKVMATLMVVGVMDTARAEILGNDNTILTPMESFSQVHGCKVCFPQASSSL